MLSIVDLVHIHPNGVRALDGVRSLDGRVCTKTAARDQVAAHLRDFDVISTRMFAGCTTLHVLADAAPGEGFEPVSGGLEDVYFSTLATSRKAA